MPVPSPCQEIFSASSLTQQGCLTQQQAIRVQGISLLLSTLSKMLLSVKHLFPGQQSTKNWKQLWKPRLSFSGTPLSTFEDSKHKKEKHGKTCCHWMENWSSRGLMFIPEEKTKSVWCGDDCCYMPILDSKDLWWDLNTKGDTWWNIDLWQIVSSCLNF